MCLTLPAQIIEINGPSATVKDYQGQQKKILITAISKPEVNDWLMINGNLAIQKISATEAEELINILK